MGSLSRLDRALVPRLGGALRGARGRGLRGIDARARGPLALLRDVPQLGAVAIGALLCGDLAVLGQRLLDQRSAAAAPAAEPAAVPGGVTEGTARAVPVSNQTGPLPGTVVADYVRDRSAVLAQRFADTPGATVAAVVSFRTYERPARLGALLPGLAVRQVLVRVGVKGTPTPAGVLPLTGESAGALAVGLSRVATALDAQAELNRRQGDTTVIYNPGNVAEKKAFYTEAAVERTEAATLRGGGPCLYAAVVTGRLSALLAATKGGAVRLADLADPGVDAVAVQPHGLIPEDSTTVGTLQVLEPLAAP